MSAKTQGRIGIFGAASLLGKELADELKESPMGVAEIVLLGDEDASGTLAAAGDEAMFIQKVEAAALEGMEFAFFTGKPLETAQHAQQARDAGASLVDMTYALERDPDMAIRAPWVTEALGLTVKADLDTAGAVSAHPAAVMLGLVLARLNAESPVAHATATVLEPASEHGREAMDELHQQTVNLLSFQSLPKEQYDAQIAFNLLAAAGPEAKMRLEQTAERIKQHYAALSNNGSGLSQGKLPVLILQLIQAPVFHGYTASVLVEFYQETTAEQALSALGADLIEVAAGDEDAPSNVSVAGQAAIAVQVKPESKKQVWLWMAVDNLKLTARNAIACAAELGRMRPQGKVQ